MSDNVCLIGNPNCGKTSLFNALTGAYQKTGNWSGVTVEKKVATYKENKNIKIIDLPGIYSLNAYSNDEKEVVKYLNDNKPSCIINVVDGTNLERSILLTSELVKLNIPMVIAVNYCDQLTKNKITLNVDRIKEFFGVDVIPISAKKDINIKDLMDSVTLYLLPKKSTVSLYKTKEEIARIINLKIKDFIQNKTTKAEVFTQKIDRIVLHRFFGIPILVLVIFLVYFLSFKLGGFFSDKITKFFDAFSNTTKIAMTNAGLPNWFISLFTSAIFKGVGSVLAFSPQILVLFLLMTLIEESGYAMRITFMMDRIFRGFGLGGKSVIPIILSCGCSVTGIMATRTIENATERKATIYLAPFMPCGAKTAVFGWISYIFFGGNALIATSMYFLGFFSIMLFGLILKRFSSSAKESNRFIIEIPTYRFPSIREIIRALWEKTKDFVYKSGTVIFAVSIIVWVLSNFGIRGYTTVIEDTFLFQIGNIVKYLFYPLGFGNWQASVSLLTGIFAKEAVVETFELLNADFTLLFKNGFSVYAFMAFLLLSPPCAASISAAKGELVKRKDLYLMLLFQFVAGYLAALAIVLIGNLLTLNTRLIFCVLVAIILVLIAIKIIIKRKSYSACKSCITCLGKKCQRKWTRYTIICVARKTPKKTLCILKNG